MDQTYLQLFFRFLRFGCLAWGGPVAQIAMIKKELVTEEKWISVEQFNRALAVYQVLPGPEAHELCVYFGMKAKGRWGGLLAGLGFMLPGFMLMLLLTWFYITYGIKSTLVQVLFSGMQAAIVALIFFAVYRIGKHAVVNSKLWVIGICSAVSFYIGVNFLIILLLAGLCYRLWAEKSKLTLIIAFAFLCINGFYIYQYATTAKPFAVAQTQEQKTQSGNAGQVFVTGLKGGLLSFGGAYTAIPLVQEDAVVRHRWMTEGQFLDGLAISGIIPAPLIIFCSFVGYFGAGWWGAILITIAVFLPAFSFTLIGHSLMERLIANRALHSFLDGVTAAVTGLIAVTAIKLLITTITGWSDIIIFAASLIILVKFRSKYTAVFLIIGAALVKLLLSIKMLN
jgi:chromate transporter